MRTQLLSLLLSSSLFSHQQYVSAYSLSSRGVIRTSSSRLLDNIIIDTDAVDPSQPTKPTPPPPASTPPPPTSIVPATFGKVKLTDDLILSPLGIGTWAWGDKFFWGYDTSQDAALYDTFKTCVSKGITFFDTAEIYGLGKSELLIARFARESGAKIDIATKFAPLPLFWRLGASGVVEACADSLDRLGVSKMALYQLHWPSLLLDDSFLDGLATCYEKGLCQGVGVSNYGASQLRFAHKKLAARGVPLLTNQIQYSLLSRGQEKNGVIAAADELGVKILAYSPLAQGILTGKFSETNLPKGPRSAVVRSVLPRVKPLLDGMRVISAENGHSLSQIALNWSMSKGVIPIPGARTVSQAEDNCGAVDWRLTEENVVMLNELSTQCGVDMPVPLQGK